MKPLDAVMTVFFSLIIALVAGCIVSVTVGSGSLIAATITLFILVAVVAVGVIASTMIW